MNVNVQSCLTVWPTANYVQNIDPKGQPYRATIAMSQHYVAVMAQSWQNLHVQASWEDIQWMSSCNWLQIKLAWLTSWMQWTLCLPVGHLHITEPVNGRSFTHSYIIMLNGQWYLCGRLISDPHQPIGMNQFPCLPVVCVRKVIPISSIATTQR